MSIAFSRWPERYLWSFQVSRMLGLADFGGSDYTEVMETCSRIRLEDPSSWDREWFETAQICEERGRAAEKVGNWVSAKNYLSRATNYYRAAQFFMLKGEGRFDIYRKIDEVFEGAAKYFPVPLTKVMIPYEGTELPGYLWKTPGAVATVVQLNGGDEISSENWFTSGSTMVEAGYNYFIFEGPGVGLTLLEKGIKRRIDTENYLGPALDYLESLPDFETVPYICIGTSFGAFDTLRASCFEKRVAAAMASSPAYELYWKVLGKWMTEEFKEYACSTVGAPDFEQLTTNPKYRYTLEGALEHMTCPLLLIQGDEEKLVQPDPLNQYLRIFNEAGTSDKTMTFVEKSQKLGGLEHCQKDNNHVQHEILLNWLCERGLGPKPR